MQACDYCGHIGGHAVGCPDGPEPPERVAYQCEQCGRDIYEGEDCFVCFDGDVHYCDDCCRQVTAEAWTVPDEFDDSDRKYDEWRDRQLMEEWENGKL